MSLKNIKHFSPSEFYKMRRPEYFSDSEIVSDIKLPKEHLAYELSQISTNQKQDEFETLCRRLAEKFISPNLIPQVGPTGGGDGKTDSETYPVSTTISDRWFVPESGWKKDEKWGFAISAKKTWKSKANGDIKKIVATKRGYTRVYFMTNQTPSSKKKKKAQDEFKLKYEVDVIILDCEWILEKIINNDLVELVASSLNLSDLYKKKVKIGQNDAYRLKKLEEIENKISNPNRYFEYDFQLVEDALEAAILSRMMEKPKDEVEGKFERAFRFCKKVNNNKQWIRLHYQRAWTYLNWYDDYSSFIEEYKSFYEKISNTSDISDIELFVTLFNLLNGLSASGNCDLLKFQIDIKKEKEKLYKILSEFEKNDDKLCSALIAKTYKALQGLMGQNSDEKKLNKCLIELSDNISKSKCFFEYPFDSFKEMIEELGSIFPNNHEFDNLIDCLALVSEERNSELAAGETYLKRGIQKLFAEYYKESIVYFGKAVLKLAKEESQNGMYLSFMGLAQAYSGTGLYWASNNCLITASSIYFKSWYETGVLNKRIYDCVNQLIKNELFIGRVPSFLTWYELSKLISRQINTEQNKENIPFEELMDACFANRILNTNYNEKVLAVIPDLLTSQELWFSQDASLYKLGYIDLILDNYKGIDINNEKKLDAHFKIMADQPCRSQMIYGTYFMEEDKISLYSMILGCKFILRFEKDSELLLTAETLLAFFESFLSTSLKNVYPHTDSIVIDIIKNSEEKGIKFKNNNSSSEYIFKINKFNFAHEAMDVIWTSMLKFISSLLSKNFIIKNSREYLENLFKNEELHERLSFIFEHRKFTINVLGENAKFFLNNWINTKSFKEYPMKRETPITYKFDDNEAIQIPTKEDFNAENISHDKRKAFSVIDVGLWDQAKWRSFGIFVDSSGLTIFIGYENIEAGKNIFDNWIKRYGKEDKNEHIKITIIKGVD